MHSGRLWQSYYRKNATNLVNHLRSKHKDVAAELQMAQSVQGTEITAAVTGYY